MIGNRPRRARQVGATAVSGIMLLATGAMLVVAWRMGWWATLTGAVLLAGWIVAAACRSALHGASPAEARVADDADRAAEPLRALLDQVPVPLIRIDAAGAHAINRAARALFDTDDRILPPVSAFDDRTTTRLRHAGRRYRIDTVDIASEHRLAVLIDVEVEERTAETRAAAEMIDILGHELLNGLSPIVSLADSAVLAAARGDDGLSDILATLARRVEGLESFTRAYRALSRLPDPVPAPVSLGDLADDLDRLFASRFGIAVPLTVDVPRDSIASVDREQLTQAIWALLQNGAEAALAGPAAASVDLVFDVTADRLVTRVTDSGGGVPAPDRARIFRPFFTTKPQGSGIGLSLAHRIARAHGGDLRLLAIGATTFELNIRPLER